MREILFRGKDVYGNWLYGDLINLTDKIKQICNHTQLEHAHSVIPETVGQFTGLTDKHSKKIFEGDILNYNDEKVYVEYYAPHLAYYFYYIRGHGAVNGFVMTHRDFEIIGNIYDNPEFLVVE